MNRPAKIALGCLFAPIGLLVIIVIVLLGAHAAGVPETRIAEKNMEQALPVAPPPLSTVLESTQTDRSSAVTRSPSTEAVKPVRVIIDMEEGMFSILPGPAEEGIQVDAEYDEGSYDLTQEYDVEEDQPVYRLRLKSKVGWLRRIAQDGSFDDRDMEQNRIEVQLPRETPMELVISLSKSESQIDLSGLSLTDLASRFRMGEFKVESREENPVPMGHLAVDMGMGECDLRGLGHLGASKIHAQGGMGELRMDFGGKLRTDTDVTLRMRLGEMTLRVPDSAIWDPESDVRATMGEVQGQPRHRRGSRQLDPELAQTLKLDGSVFMGSLVLEEFRSRASNRSGSED